MLRGQGHACVFPEGAENPIWVPSQFVKTYRTHRVSDAEAPPDGGGEVPKPPKNQTNRDPVTESNKDHPYWSYKRQHRHIDKRSKTTQGSTPPTWGQIKCLVDMVKNAIKWWGQEETPAVLLLAMITIISHQVNAAEA
jgi:hypothetical protein